MRAAQDRRDLLVARCDSDLSVDDKEDEIGLGDRSTRLIGDLGRQRRGVDDVHAAGVDEAEPVPRPLAGQVLAIPCHAGGLVHDRCPRAGEPVDQRRLADVGEAHDGDGAEKIRAHAGGVATRGRPSSCISISQCQRREISSPMRTEASR